MSSEAITPRRPPTERERVDARVPALVHGDWEARLPWVVQGTTIRGSPGAPYDLGLYAGATPEHLVYEHWNRLLAVTGMRRAVHARQVHGANVLHHHETTPGLTLTEPCDGHVTAEPGILLTVTVADCVPVFVVASKPRAVAVLHAGWRGTAAGVLENGLSLFAEDLGVTMSGLLLHLGPSICGRCYEVGSEVFRALGQPEPDAPTPIDLRAVLAERAVQFGIAQSNVSVSGHCTRCTDSDLFSHRGGDGGRQVGYLGIRP